MYGYGLTHNDFPVQSWQRGYGAPKRREGWTPPTPPTDAQFSARLPKVAGQRMAEMLVSGFLSPLRRDMVKEALAAKIFAPRGHPSELVDWQGLGRKKGLSRPQIDGLIAELRELAVLQPSGKYVAISRLDEAPIDFVAARKAEQEARYAHIPFTLDPRFPLAEKAAIQGAIDLIQGEPFKASGYRPPQPLENIKGYLRNHEMQYEKMIARSPELLTRSIPCVSLDFMELVKLKRDGEIDEKTYRYCQARKNADTQGYLVEVYKAEIAKQEAIKASGGMTQAEKNKARMMEAAVKQMQQEMRKLPNDMLLMAIKEGKEQIAQIPVEFRDMANRNLSFALAEAERRGLKPATRGARNGQNIHSAAQSVAEPTKVQSIYNTGKNKVGIIEEDWSDRVEPPTGFVPDTTSYDPGGYKAKAEHNLKMRAEGKARQQQQMCEQRKENRARKKKEEQMLMLAGLGLAAAYLLMGKK